MPIASGVPTPSFKETNPELASVSTDHADVAAVVDLSGNRDFDIRLPLAFATLGTIPPKDKGASEGSRRFVCIKLHCESQVWCLVVTSTPTPYRVIERIHPQGFPQL